MFKNLSRNKLFHILCMIMFILTPLLSAIVFCAVDGKTIADIYIPLGGWSDEITYYKQIEGMVSYGIPKGYFGYDQSKAVYGPFGYWGILPLIPYAIWGVLFGWTYSSLIYANIFYCVIAFAFIYFFLRPNKKWCLSFAAFWCCFQFLIRHILSGAIEAFMIQLLVFVFVIGECLLSEKVRAKMNLTPLKDTVLIVICTGIVFFMTVIRPYYAVFYLIPFWVVIQKKKIKGIITVPLVALLSMICFVLYKEYFCAAYFDDVIRIEDMLSGGIMGIFTMLFNNTLQIFKYVWYALRYYDVTGWYYSYLFVEWAIMFLACLYNAFRKKVLPKMYIVALVGEILIVISIMLLFTMVVGGRHILTLIVANAVILITETHIGIGGILALVGILCTLLSGKNEPLPYADDEYVAWMETLEEVFAEHMVVTDELSYDNVIGMPVRDKSREDGTTDTVTYYGYLYAVPAGIGVSLDYDYVYEDPENVKAKYVLAHPDGMIRLKLEEMGMKCVVEMDELVLYMRE